MPYSKCPLCGQISHLNVANVADWYKERYPDLRFGSLVPHLCFYCWQELGVGDRVIVRNHFSNEPAVELGSVGTITSILSSEEHGSIYAVELDSGNERYFVRGELRKPHEEEA